MGDGHRIAGTDADVVINSDDISGIWTDVIKLAFGALGTATLVSSSEGLPVNVVAGASNTQYTEGATDASITGTAALMEGAADTLLPIQGTVADGLLVNLGTNNDVTVTGSVTANAGTNLNTSA